MMTMMSTTSTELYDNKSVQQEEQLLLTGTTTTSDSFKHSMCSDDHEVQALTNPSTEQQRNNHLAKINWWNTPFKPLTIETVINQQCDENNTKLDESDYQKQQQPQEDHFESNILLLHQGKKNDVAAANAVEKSDKIVTADNQRYHYEQFDNIVVNFTQEDEDTNDKNSTYLFRGNILA